MYTRILVPLENSKTDEAIVALVRIADEDRVATSVRDANKRAVQIRRIDASIKLVDPRIDEIIGPRSRRAHRRTATAGARVNRHADVRVRLIEEQLVIEERQNLKGPAAARVVACFRRHGAIERHAVVSVVERMHREADLL